MCVFAVDSSLANPSINADIEQPQPNIFEGILKGYQLKVFLSLSVELEVFDQIRVSLNYHGFRSTLTAWYKFISDQLFCMQEFFPQTVLKAPFPLSLKAPFILPLYIT